LLIFIYDHTAQAFPNSGALISKHAKIMKRDRGKKIIFRNANT
jgi:hypothetical protein